MTIMVISKVCNQSNNVYRIYKYLTQIHINIYIYISHKNILTVIDRYYDLALSLQPPIHLHFYIFLHKSSETTENASI